MNCGFACNFNDSIFHFADRDAYDQCSMVVRDDYGACTVLSSDVAESLHRDQTACPISPRHPGRERLAETERRSWLVVGF